MKQTLKATAAIIGTAAAVAVAIQFLKLIGAMMIHISETCNIPL